MTPVAAPERPRIETPEVSSGSLPRRSGGPRVDRRPELRPGAPVRPESVGAAGPERFLFPVV